MLRPSASPRGLFKQVVGGWISRYGRPGARTKTGVRPQAGTGDASWQSLSSLSGAICRWPGLLTYQHPAAFAQRKLHAFTLELHHPLVHGVITWFWHLSQPLVPARQSTAGHAPGRNLEGMQWEAHATQNDWVLLACGSHQPLLPQRRD